MFRPPLSPHGTLVTPLARLFNTEVTRYQARHMKFHNSIAMPAISCNALHILQLSRSPHSLRQHPRSTTGACLITPILLAGHRPLVAAPSPLGRSWIPRTPPLVGFRGCLGSCSHGLSSGTRPSWFPSRSRARRYLFCFSFSPVGQTSVGVK